MKKNKILILSNNLIPDDTLFIEEGKKINIEVDRAQFIDIFSYVDNETLKVTIKNKPLNDYQIIYLRTLIQDQFIQIALCDYCINHKILLVDSCFEINTSRIHNKFQDYIKLQKATLPIIDTLLTNLEVESKYIPFEYPFIVKSPSGSKGEDVYLVKNESDLYKLKTVFSKSVLLQKYIPSNSDIRVLVINNKTVGAIQRISQVDEFRNNVSLGARVEVFKVPNDLKFISEHASQILGYEIAGIDAIWDEKSNNWKIIEVNRVPQFKGFMEATNINVYEKIMQFFAEKINSSPSVTSPAVL